MKAIKAMGTIDDKGQLALDSPLAIDKQSRVEVIILVAEETTEKEDLTKEEILGDLHQAWQEVKSGKTIPVEELWSD